MQDLPFQTLTQFVALGLMLIAGWLLGLASASGGRKWRERCYDEELNNAGYRDRAETDLRDSARRIRDLEAENARLRSAAPAPVQEGHSTAALAGAAVAGAAASAVATNAVHEHHPEPIAAAPAEPAPAEPAHTAPTDVEAAPEPQGAPLPAADAHHH